jgi:ferric-dicitrate binding protein FerR (iron transport regulator)
MMETNKNDIVLKLILNELSEEEKKAVFERMESDSELRDFFYESKNLAVKTGFTSMLSPQQKERDYKSIWKHINQKGRRSALGVFYRYAAVIVLTLCIGTAGGYLFKSSQQLTPTVSQTYVFSSGDKGIADVVLPDGSQLKLNSKTRITYQYNRQTQERLLTLNGEAFFDVVHNESSPFIIDFKGLKIVDVGTQFNVKAYPFQNNIETTLIEGAIELVEEDGETALMQPGQMAQFNLLTKDLRIKEIDDNGDMAWLKSRFEFKNESLESILNELGHWYNVELIWENDSARHIMLHFNIERDMDIDSVMEIIQLNTGINYEIKSTLTERKKIIIK